MSNAGQRARRVKPRTFVLAAALTGLVGATLVTTTAVAARPDPGFQVNPDLQASCGTDVIVILDESGSIDSSNAQGNVASALNAFVTGLQGTNSRMRIVEFSTNARDAEIGGSTAFRDVDTSFANDVQTYLTPTLGAFGDQTQDPWSYRPWNTQFQGNQIYTNWEAALYEAAAPGSPTTSNVGAPLVVFLTDGNPNTIGTAGDSTGGNTAADPASDAAIEEMAALQTAGGHVVSMAVGQAVTQPQPFGRLINLTEPHVPAQVVWNGTGVLNLRTTDAIQVSDFSAIDDALRSVVFALCAPSLTLHKSDQDGGDVPDWDFSTTVQSMSGGTSLDWIEPADPGQTAPTTKTKATDSSGSALFQWTPGSAANPEQWSSTVYIEETLPAGWTVDPSTYATDNQNCSVARLNDDGTVSNFTVDLSKTSPAGDPLPGDTVRYDFVNGNGVIGPFALDKADIMTCDVRNQAPSTITIAKSATPLTPPDSTPFAFTTSSGAALVPLPPSFSLDDDGSDTPLPSSETYTVSPGTFAITETAQNYWDLTSIECTDQTGQVTATPNLPAGSVEIVMPAGGAITCTFNNIERPQPALNLTKTASPLTFQEKDGSVTYTLLINNPNGNTNPITITTISDSQEYNGGAAEVVDLSVADPPPNGVGDVTSNDCHLLIGQVVGNADLTCSFTVAYTGTNADDYFDDLARVIGDDKYGVEVVTYGPAHVDVTPVPPQMIVDKQNVQPISVVAPGGPATYSVNVTNPAGAIETITLTQVTDQMLVDGGNFGAPLDITTLDGTIITATTCTDLVGTVLAPGASYSCQFTVDTLAVNPPENFEGNESLVNLVTITAEDDDPTPQEIELTDGAQRTIDAEPPAISVFKTDNGAEIVEPGSQITYDIDIHNLGTAESLTIDKIEDEIWFGPGLTPEGVVTIEDDPPGGAVEVTTTLPGPQGATFVSTTCDTLIGTSLDPAVGVDGQGIPTNTAASASCQITLDLPANAGDIYNDQVRVDATAAQGGPVSANNSANTPAVGIDPAVTLAKSPDYPTDDVTVPETGGDATFTIEITNSSTASTDPITLNTLTDSVFGDLFDPGNTAITDISCVALLGSTLAQGATTSCQFSAFLSGTVAVPHTNTATVTVTDDEGIEVTGADDGAVGFTNVLPTITVLKTPSPDTVSEYGANVTFSVVVTNTSLEPVTLTSLVDSVYGDLSVLSGSGCALGGTIAPSGGTYSCDFTQFVEQDQSVTPGAGTHDNTVTAIAQDDEGFDATAEDPATVTFTTTPPTVEVTKTDGGASVDEPGGTVTYTITVENTSQEPVTITTLTDTITYSVPVDVIGPIDLFSATAPITSSTCAVTDLAASDGAPGGPDEMTCSFDVQLEGTSQVVDDIVNVTVTDNDGETGDAESPDNTPINDVPPAVQVVKYANGQDVSTRVVPGEEVTYLFEIFNRSTVEDIRIESLVDDVFGDVTAECGFDGVPGTWLTPDDGNDSSGTDQTTCTILRTPVTDPPGLPEYDHVNTVTVEAADDEIIRSRGGENPLPNVSDDDSVTVEMREPAKITVTKTASPADAPFDFQLNGGDEQRATPAAGVYPPLAWTDLDEGTYELTETLPAGWELTSITCESGDPPVDKQFGDITNGASLDVVWGEDVSCVFDNTQLGDVDVTKTVSSGPTQQAGTDLYDIIYQIVVTNNSFRDETINITDSLGITGDITVDTIGTITSIPAIGFDPTWNGQGNTQLSDGDQTIAGSTSSAGDSTILVSIPVTYRVPGSTAALDLECPTAGTGGAANNVSVAHSGTGDNPAEADACQPFGAPSTEYTKSVSSSAALDPDTGIWSIAYDIVVTNTGDGADEYTLEDELKFGAGVVIGSVTPTVVSTSGQTDPAAPTTADLSPAFNGVSDTTVIADVPIVAGAIHTYRISVAATIPTPTAGTGACNPDGTTAGGFLNVSNIDGSTSNQPSACDPFSTLQLTKIVNNQHGGSAQPTDFTLTGTNGETPPVVVTGDGTAIAAVPADDYTLSESSVEGYQQASLLCVGGVLTDDSVNVADGTDVLCTFNNDDTPTGSVTVQKIATPGDEQDFEFSLTGQANQITTAAGGYEPLTWMPLSDGNYALDEIIPADWQLSGIECSTSEGTFQNFVETATGATFDLRWMEDVLCTFTNTKLGDVTVEKTLTAGPTQQAGTDLYDVTYQIVATNQSFREETINITDSLGIAGDVTVESIGTITTNPAFALDATWDGDTVTQLSDGDQPIAASAATAGDSTVTITIPVTFRVPGSASTAALACQPGDPADDGGSLNAVSVSSSTTGQDPADDEACEDFPASDISWDKSVVGTPTHDATSGIWTVVYDVVVSNTGDGAGEYTLTDELRYSPSVVVGTVTAGLDSSTDQTDPTAPGDGIVNGSFDGVGDTTVVTGADIVAGATHTWRITVTATIPAVTAGDGQCNPDGTTAGGFLNVADIDGATSTTPSACAPFSTLELFKIVDSGDGGNADPTDFTLTATGTGTPPVVVEGAGTVIEAVPVDIYQLTETDVPGYGLVSISCNDDPIEPDPSGDYSVNVGEEDDVRCVFTNDDGVVDLEITKTDDDVTAYEGGAPFDYTITVTNIGDRDVDTGEPVTVVDTLPAGLSWVTVPSECVQNAQEITCDLDPADLTAGASVVLTPTVQADAGTPPGTYTNYVYVTTQDDPVCTPIDDCTPPPCDSDTNNVACEDTPVLDRSLDVSGFTDVCVGDAPYIGYLIVPIGFSPPPTQATLTIMDVNGNPIDYNGDGTVDDDDKVIVTTMTGNLLWPGAEVDSAGNAVDWPGWKFENGLWVVDPTDAIYREGLLIEVEINPTAVAMVSYPPESSACADPTQVSADLQIVKTTTATEVLPGQSFTWDLTVTNNGPDEATSVVVTDQVPAPLVLTDVSSSDFSCSNSGNSMTCTRPSLAVGATGTIQLTTTVPAGTQPVSNVTNVADITAVTPDPDPDNNSDSSATSIGCVNCLPGTGGDVGDLLRIAIGLVLGGLALLFIQRRRRPPRRPTGPLQPRRPDTTA